MNGFSDKELFQYMVVNTFAVFSNIGPNPVSSFDTQFSGSLAQHSVLAELLVVILGDMLLSIAYM